MIAEPGRYFAGACHTLAVRVFARRAPTETTADEGRYLYYVNDGLYGSFNCLLYDHATVTPELLRYIQPWAHTHTQTRHGAIHLCVRNCVCQGA